MGSARRSIDKDGTLRSAMLNEICEETGLVVENAEAMRELSSSTPYASPGLLDEQFKLFSLEVSETMFHDGGTGSVMERLSRRADATMGCHDEGEIITKVAAFPIDAAPVEDAKFCLLLDAARRDGIW